MTPPEMSLLARQPDGEYAPLAPANQDSCAGARLIGAQGFTGAPPLELEGFAGSDLERAWLGLVDPVFIESRRPPWIPGNAIDVRRLVPLLPRPRAGFSPILDGLPMRAVTIDDRDLRVAGGFDSIACGVLYFIICRWKG